MVETTAAVIIIDKQGSRTSHITKNLFELSPSGFYEAIYDDFCRYFINNFELHSGSMERKIVDKRAIKGAERAR